MPASVTCPRCGAPLPPEAASAVSTCPFCGATAAPAATERVVERIVERVVVVAPSGDEEAAGAMRCPRCAVALREASSGETLLRGCRRCGGIWLDNATVERVSKVRDDQLEHAARRLVGHETSSPPNRLAEISCPSCGKPLRRDRVPDTRHCVDVCAEHGTWFDGDELPMFIRTFAEARAGEVTTEDLNAAGVPGDARGEEGFFTNFFRLLRSGT